MGWRLVGWGACHLHAWLMWMVGISQLLACLCPGAQCHVHAEPQLQYSRSELPSGHEADCTIAGGRAVLAVEHVWCHSSWQEHACSRHLAGLGFITCSLPQLRPYWLAVHAAGGSSAES